MKLTKVLHCLTYSVCRHAFRPKYPVLIGVRPFATRSKDIAPQSYSINGKVYPTDEWTNIPSSIISATEKRLHLQPNHPVSIIRQFIESRFPDYAAYNDFHPVVTVHQNFDSLGFPPDHPGRNRTDTYYVNKNTVLRTHTSAHQAEIFKRSSEDGWLITSDVYRRDAVDKTHYPIFHQMEGARTWDRTEMSSEDSTRRILDDIKQIPTHDVEVLDPNPTTQRIRNPLQDEYHTASEVEAIALHLKRSLENVVISVFKAASGTDSTLLQKELKIRWVEAYFPFTSPSWELEVLWQGDWLEVLGCGVVKHELLVNAGLPQRLGWAFGMGLERIAMLLFSIPDIRLFWSSDPRFLSQFIGATRNPASKSDFLLSKFVPFSKHPPCYKDVSFWVGTTSQTSNAQLYVHCFHENDFMEVIRDVAGDLVEEVKLVDDFVHPKTTRRSVCYRINYRSLERTMTNAETNVLHERLCGELERRLQVVIR